MAQAQAGYDRCPSGVSQYLHDRSDLTCKALRSMAAASAAKRMHVRSAAAAARLACSAAASPAAVASADACACKAACALSTCARCSAHAVSASLRSSHTPCRRFAAYKMAAWPHVGASMGRYILLKVSAHPEHRRLWLLSLAGSGVNPYEREHTRKHEYACAHTYPLPLLLRREISFHALARPVAHEKATCALWPRRTRLPAGAQHEPAAQGAPAPVAQPPRAPRPGAGQGLLGRAVMQQHGPPAARSAAPCGSPASSALA